MAWLFRSKTILISLKLYRVLILFTFRITQCSIEIEISMKINVYILTKGLRIFYKNYKHIAGLKLMKFMPKGY